MTDASAASNPLGLGCLGDKRKCKNGLPHLTDDVHAAFQLHSVGAPLLDEPHTVPRGLVRRQVAAKRQVGHQEGALCPARRRLAVMDHLRDGHLGCIFLPEHNHPERIADEQHVSTRPVGNAGARVVIRRDHAQRFVPQVFLAQPVQANLLGRRRLGCRCWHLNLLWRAYYLERPPAARS